MKKGFKQIVLAVVVGGLWSPSARAQWLGTTSTNWFTGSNWLSGSVPTSSTGVQIGLGIYNATNQPVISGANAVAGYLTVANATATPHQLTIQGGGTLTVAGSARSDVGQSSEATGTVTVTGSGSALSFSAGDFYVGSAGNGTLAVASGGVVNAGAPAYLWLGNSSGATGAATVDGTGSQINARVRVGGGGTGSVTVSNGGYLSSTDAIIGYASGGNGTVTVTGAGSSASFSDLQLAPGTSNVTATLNIFNGGSVATTTGQGNVGNTTAGTGAITISGSGSQYSSSAGNDLNVTRGSVEVSAGGALNLGRDLTLGANGVLNVGAYAGGTTGGTVTANHVTGLAAGAVVNFNQTDASTYSALTTGALSLVQRGTGTTAISTANTFTGGTTVSAGTLTINNVTGSALGSGAVTVASGGKLAGAGSFTGALTLSGMIAPGNSPGTMTTGAETWNGGGSYLWEINKATGGTAGGSQGWDLLSISGALMIAATSGSQFTIAVTSLDLANAAGQASGFDTTLNYSFTLGSATGGISGFSANKFSIDTSAFQNPFTGTWSIAQSGNDLNLVYTGGSAIPEPATGAVLAGLGVLVIAAGRRRRDRSGRA